MDIFKVVEVFNQICNVHRSIPEMGESISQYYWDFGNDVTALLYWHDHDLVDKAEILWFVGRLKKGIDGKKSRNGYFGIYNDTLIFLEPVKVEEALDRMPKDKSNNLLFHLDLIT
jgi:hypothetical protein